MRVHPVPMEAAVDRILGWARNREGRMVCAADAHMVMVHRDQPEFRKVMAHADLVTPDGMALVWTLNRKGWPAQERVCGSDLCLAVFAAAQEAGIPVGFLGGRQEVLDQLVLKVRAGFPGLRIVYRWSPPFRDLAVAEERRQLEAMARAGVGILFIGLGCPKQERWMARHKARCRWPMLGVGAAFDFHARAVRRAPPWVQRLGLEWAFRFALEPRRLWKRALYHCPRFAWLSISEFLIPRR
jgi:N-acetylglucosaminyldiphosphoundecaprenol N-acetyl-beta-D-mannosaminyltransferase